MIDIDLKTVIEYINLTIDNLDLIITDIDDKWPKDIDVTKKKYFSLFKDIISKTYSITFQNKYGITSSKYISINLSMKSDWMIKTEEGIPLVIAIVYHEHIIPISLLELIIGINCGSVYINYNRHIWEAIRKHRRKVAKLLSDNTSQYSFLTFNNRNIYMRGKKLDNKKETVLLNNKFKISK